MLYDVGKSGIRCLSTTTDAWRWFPFFLDIQLPIVGAEVIDKSDFALQFFLRLFCPKHLSKYLLPDAVRKAKTYTKHIENWVTVIVNDIQSTLDIPNTDISKDPLIYNKQSGHYFIFVFISIPILSNYWYFKVNFLGPENLLWDISSLG